MTRPLATGLQRRQTARPSIQPAPFRRHAVALCALLAAAGACGAPTGGVVSAGAATIATGTPGTTTITQTTPNAAINWHGFGVAAGESVQFRQPGPNAITLNRVLGPEASAIFGSLSANGRVFLVNPNGILFGSGASVNVAGLVASTLGITDADFMAGRYRFEGSSTATVVNRGDIRADGGYVALLGADVANHGLISARLGSVALAAGRAVTLDIAGDNLLNVAVEQGAVNALVRNGGAIQADGGQILLTAQAANNLVGGAVNNTGVLQARTLDTRGGTIRLMADMQGGTVTVDGKLDASAPAGGNGGFIETSAAHVRVQDSAIVTTAAPLGRTGEWLIDPHDFTIGGGAGDNISGATLSALLVTNSVVISTMPGPTSTVAGTPPVTSMNTAVNGNGDIHVNQAIAWTATPSTTTLTLNAARDVNINQAITATNGNLVACCGRDVNVNAAITTTNGSVSLSAGRNAVLGAAGAMTSTVGNIQICAANDILVGSALTINAGNTVPAQSLGLPPGLTLSAGLGGTGPGPAAGTVIFAPLAPVAAVTGPSATATVHYNPVAYTTPTDYSSKFTLTNGATLVQRMLVFASGADKLFDGTTAAILAGLKGNPAGVSLVAGPGSTANFDTAAAGVAKPVTSSGYTLAGPNAANFALAVACCGPAAGTAATTGTILPVPPVAPILPGPIPLVPVPAVVVPAPVVVVNPEVQVAPMPVAVEQAQATQSAQSLQSTQFAPFVIAPALLRPTGTLLVVEAPRPAPMRLVSVREEPAPAVAPAAPAPTNAAPPPPAPAPVLAPRPAPAPLPPKPYRN
jgi:filamentous hemagglutinin family protein